MKKLILFLSITLVFAFELSAQSKFITKETYNDALVKAAQKQESVPRRVTGIINFYDSNKAVYEKRTTINEYLSAGTFRTVFTTEKSGNITEKYEFIKIGNVEYTKKNDDPWTKKVLPEENGVGGGGGFLTGKIIKTERLEEFLLIPANIDNRAVNVYFHYEVSQTEGENNLTFIESRNSISAEGLTLKWTYKVSKSIPENISHFSTTTYEYNPKDLKIEAPIK
jgi:hypothetical protein